jgi:hypothetical protein
VTLQHSRPVTTHHVLSEKKRLNKKTRFYWDTFYIDFCPDSLYFRVRVMLFNTTFNNISVISFQLVLSVGETVVPGENN